MSKDTTNNSTKVVTGLVRFSYANVFEPKASEEGATPKYSVQLLIPKKDKDTVAKINAAVEAAKKAGVTTFGGKIPAVLKLPLRDGDEERGDNPVYAGHYFINCNSVNKPNVVDSTAAPIQDKDEFYSGCYGHASVKFYAFAGKSKGIACGLNSVMKKKDGEPLGGSKENAAEAFDSVLSEDDNDLM